MKKRMWTLFLAVFAAVAMTACGGSKVETQEVDYDMTFENQTGIDVEKLEIRYAEDAEWMEIALEGGIWQNSYQVPVSMQGQMPVAEDGWQVQMTFDGEIQKIWEGVGFGDDLILAFKLNGGETLVETRMDAMEGDVNEAEAMELVTE